MPTSKPGGQREPVSLHQPISEPNPHHLSGFKCPISRQVMFAKNHRYQRGLCQSAEFGEGTTHAAIESVFFTADSLWCGFFVELAECRVYFAGDTGFGDHFAYIRERFGSPRLALLPIGACEPRWFMSPIHMAPDEAVLAHKILAAKTSTAFLVLGNGLSVTL